MSVTVIESGKRRELRPEDVDSLLEMHPVPVAAEARQLFGRQELTLRTRKVPRALSEALQVATRRVVVSALSDVGPAESRDIDPQVSLVAEVTDLPVYQFVPPPAALTAAAPQELPAAGATRLFSAYREAPFTLLKAANEALATLATMRYMVPDGDDRAGQMDALGALLTTVAAAARSFSMMAVRPAKRYLELAPGELPSLLAQTLETYVRSLRPQEKLDTALLNELGRCLGQPVRPQDAPALDQVATFYTGIDEKLWPLMQEMPTVLGRLLGGEDVPWWLDGESLESSDAPTAADLKTGAGNHLIIPAFGPRPSTPPPTPYPQAGSAPIVLTVSDLHLGQGSTDPADEGYPELEDALVGMLNAWSDRVLQHRARFGPAQPAYLVLNGDVLDFWSADLKELAGGGDRFELDLENDNGKPRLTAAISGGRMRRILDAHAPFFKRITRWVDEDRLNFVVYVCGNHDDHLERFGLGGALATALHPTRGAFAAKSLHFPDLCTIIEHGHRGDEFNAWQGDGSDMGVHGSLGELLVATLINPAERGGASILDLVEATFKPFLDQSGLNAGFLDDLGTIYSHFRRCYEVKPTVYRGCMGCIDNLDSGGLEEVPADYAGRVLVERNRDGADAADVSNLDADIRGLTDVWLKSHLQSLAKQYLGPALAHMLPPSTQAYLVDKVFAADHAARLRFEPGRGLFGDAKQRIHLVGHTHHPEATDPPIDGRIVFAQHVNTGTGQDTWTPEDDGAWFDVFDLEEPIPLPIVTSVEESEDTLTPLPRSNYCILEVTPVLMAIPTVWRMIIETGEFRTVQTHRPEDAPNRVDGGLFVKGANATVLN